MAPKPGTPLDPEDLEVLLVHRPQYRDWSWPKGKSESNEPIAQTAVREVEEETGAIVTLDHPLTTQRYRLGSGHIKEVYYWTGQLIGDNPARSARPPVIRASRKEIDVTLWAKPSRARQMLTRRGDRRLLDELVNHAVEATLDSATLILVRHAKATSRKAWDGPEQTRPLTRLGGTQALDLVPLLSAFGVDQLYASPWLRTEQTLAPYGALTREAIHLDGRLTEAAATENPVDLQVLMGELMGHTSGRRAVCVHRPTVKDLLKPVVGGRPFAHFPALERPKRELRTAEMFVIHLEHSRGEPRPVTIERHSVHTKLIGG